MQVENFLNYLKFEKRYSDHTLLAYKTDLNQFTSYILLEFEIDNVNEVNHHIIRSWISNLLESGISSRSVNRKITTLKSLYNFFSRRI